MHLLTHHQKSALRGKLRGTLVTFTLIGPFQYRHHMADTDTQVGSQMATENRRSKQANFTSDAILL